MQIDHSKYIKHQIGIDFYTDIDGLISQLVNAKESLLLPVIDHVGGYDDNEYIIVGYRKRTPQEIIEYKKTLTKEKDLKEKRNLAADKNDRKELARLAKKYKITIPDIPPISKPAPENVIKDEVTQKIIGKSNGK